MADLPRLSRSLRARRVPRDNSSCGWWETLPPPPPARKVTGEVRVDCAVIGAGFTGLSTARQLAKHHPDRRIALLEAQRVGFGATGRNSGFVGDIFHRDPDLGVEGNRRLKNLGKLGVDRLRDLVREHAIDCDWSEIGRIHAARENATRNELNDLAEFLEEIGEPYRRMDAEALRSETGSAYYREGVHIPATVLLQPAALARGLGASLPENVDLYEASPVVGVDPGPPFRLQAGDGTVVADRIFLTLNAFAPALGLLRRRVFPLVTYASLTRPLTEAEQAEMGDEREWGMRSENKMGPTIRRTQDQRVLYRILVRYDRSMGATPARLQSVKKRHHAGLTARFPVLRDVELEYTWSGVMGMSLNDAQAFGRLYDNVYVSVAYNGRGVAMGTASGTLLADLSAGADSRLLSDIQDLRKPSWLPFEPFLGMGVSSYTTYLYHRAGQEG
jgi:glycine/D-amino acid oxidase-like deaminating enzyme